MWARTKTVLLVLLMAWAVLPFSGFGGNSPQQPAGAAAQNVYLLSFASPDSKRVLPALNIEVLVDYNNGDYLARGGSFDAAYLKEFGVILRDLPDRTTVSFPASGYSFDTLVGPPALPPYLTSSAADERIVQFIGPIKSEWVQAVESVGTYLNDYLDSFAFVAKMSDAQVAAVRALPFVNWVGQYQPAYKIQSELLMMSGFVPISVIAYEGVGEDQLRSIVEGIGGEVTMTSTQPTSVEATVHTSMIPAMARSSDVTQIFWSPEKVPLDWQAGEIHHFHQAWVPAKSGLPTNLTGHSPGPDGIQGNADDVFEVVGIQDSGFDLNNPNAGWVDTFQGPLGDRVVNLRKWTGQCSQSDGKVNGVAHGTHVAGIVVSNGWGWEKQYGMPTDDFQWDQSEAGIVPEGKLSFDCVGSGGGIASSPIYWDSEYADGAKTMSNSYGTSNRVYDPNFAGGADQRIDASNDKMIIFAVGNDGPESNTVSGVAKSKNGLAIGASQNFRPDQFEADNPNLMADFSSRGNPAERYKPDLVAVGTAVISGLGVGEWLFNAGPGGQGVPQPDYIMQVDQYDYRIPGPGQDGIADYRYMQGTSMASPQAAGLYMLTREYFREVWGINNVNSQLAKAMLINGAVRMDPNLYAYPGIDQGWGRIDLKQSLFPPAPRSNQFEEGLFTTTGTWHPSTINMNVQTPDVPLKVTLVWIDREGASLSRKLDLIVRNPEGTEEYHGDRYATTGPLKGWSDPSLSTFDQINNVEQVEVQFPSPGLWSVEVKATSIPATTNFALVFSADVGPRKTYQVNIETKYPTILSVAPGGTASLPFIVKNFGSSDDNISVSHNSADIGVSFDWIVSDFKSTQSKDNLAIFSASKTTPARVYAFCIKAESLNDPATPKASDSLCVQVEVLSAALPYARRITSESIDELDPSVLTFNYSGTSHIFIAYRKTTPIDPLDLTHGGTNVWIAHNTLNANHEPAGPWTYSVISDWNDYPNDLRFLYIDSGTYTGRVVLTWTGKDPLEPVPESQPWGRIAYSDPPYGTWDLRTIEKNYGSNVYNSARVSFPLFRKVGGAGGTLIWVWEHLDSASTTAPGISAVQTHAAFSFDGGNTWGDCNAGLCYKIAPPSGNTNYYFFPNGVIDQNDVLWVFFYWRPSGAGQGRRLAVSLWDGPTWNTGWTSAINIWDAGGSANIQFPAAVSTPEGGNRVYVAVTNDAGALDKQLFTLYAQGTFGSGIVGPPPAAAPSPGRSSSFSVPEGPLGTAVSDANYNRRPVLVMVYTDDGIVWVPYMEVGNLYGVPNMWTWYSKNAFPPSDRNLTIVTADAFAKGHQMADTLTIGSKSCVYEVWHENIAPTGSVNYDVYLAIYCAGWENEADNLGPVTVNQATIPNPYNRTYPSAFRIKADINDISTGFNNISAAQLVTTALTVNDPTLVDWTDAWVMNLTGVNRSPSETAWVWANWTVSGWAVGTCHRYWIRGQDQLGNWGSGDFVDVCVTQATAKPPPPPAMQKAELTGVSYQDVTLTWTRSFDDGNGVNNVLLYKVWRATSIYGPYSVVASVSAIKVPTYNWPDANAGHGDFNNYFYYVQANSSLFDSPPTKLAAKFYRTMSAGTKELLSFPLVQASYGPTAVFKTFTYDSVRTYTPVDQDHWKSYKPGKPYNDITALDIKEGYWVDMTAPGTMTVAGLVPENVFVNLYQGWNLVGFPSFNATYTIANFTASLPPGTLIEIYKASVGPYYLQRLPQNQWATTVMQPGLAYWVYVSSTTQWAVPGY